MPVSRPLSPIEATLFTLDRGRSLNFTTVARLRGPLEAGAIEAGLAAVQQRHPLVGVRIAYDPPALRWPRFESEGVGPIPLRHERRPDGQAVFELVEEELNAPLPWSTGPLIRACLIEHDPSDHTLLVTFHHGIGDGMSGIFLVRDLLRAASHQSPPESAEALARVVDASPLDDRLGPSVHGVGGTLRRAGFMAGQLWSGLVHGMPLGVVPERDVPPDERRVQLHHRTLQPDLVERLHARARKEGTTLHGAMSAAMALAILEEQPRPRRGTIAFGSPVNLRASLDPAPGEAVGLYVGLVEYRAPHRRHRELWPLARAIRDQLGRDVQAGTPQQVLSVMDWLHRGLGGLGVEPRVFGARYASIAPNTGALTNLGKLDLDETFGDVSIEALHFGVSPSSLGTFVATATGVGGGVLWNFCSQAPILSRQRGDALADETLRRVAAAVE